MKQTQSAGGVVLNLNNQVLVTNQHGNSWSLPKGRIEIGENALNAAKREIADLLTHRKDKEFFIRILPKIQL